MTIDGDLVYSLNSGRRSTSKIGITFFPLFLIGM